MAVPSDDQRRVSRLLPSRRALRFLRVMALAAIVIGPIARAAWDLHRTESADLGYPEVLTPDAFTPTTGPAARVGEYLKNRSPIVDLVLPAGAGGVRFYEHLDGAAGMAFAGVATIGIAADADLGWWPESTEIHERAHLAYAFLPAVVGPLMAAMPPPAASEYAATNPGEHFAEMAATAWQIVRPPEGICIDGTPESNLREAEARVPGTAGFVAWFLRQPSLADPHLLEAAESMLGDSRAEWEALWRALEARRGPAGRFDRWRHLTIRDHIESARFDLRMRAGWAGPAASLLFLPSLAVLALVGA
jgi:hypothetical protein